MAAVRLVGVWKTYDRVRYVLEDVSLTVEPGEIVVLMGRSGSGKTTLLNLVAGLDRPTRGTVSVQDQDLGTMSEEQRTAWRLRRIGVVFQRFHLIPELTAWENVRLPLRLAGRRDADARATHLMKFFGLDGLADAYPATLSGGETQRVALARGLANEPAVVLADEPTANLDEENARLALRELRRVAVELGTGVLVATHDPMTESVASRVLRVVDGRLGAPTPPAGGPSAAPRPAPAPASPTPGKSGPSSSR